MSLVPLYLSIRAADSFVGTSSMMITAPDLGSVILKVNKQVKGSPWALCDNQDKTRQDCIYSTGTTLIVSVQEAAPAPM
jgi:hypothetical protein